MLEDMGDASAANQDGGTDCRDCIIECCREACCDGGVQEIGCEFSFSSCAGSNIQCPVSRRRLENSFEIVHLQTNATLATDADEHARYLEAVAEFGEPRYGESGLSAYEG
tara:strand:+ start:14370 stop:14699 length:330 start_codon:yes stop_codon:yes gene_type:complete